TTSGVSWGFMSLHEPAAALARSEPPMRPEHVRTTKRPGKSSNRKHRGIALRALAAGFAVLAAQWAAISADGPATQTLYLSGDGNDANSGSGRDHAWRTIQHAADTLGPGQTAIVLAGAYKERVSIKSSGTSNAPISLRAGRGGPVRVKGFSVSGSHWIVESF